MHLVFVIKPLMLFCLATAIERSKKVQEPAQVCKGSQFSGAYLLFWEELVALLHFYKIPPKNPPPKIPLPIFSKDAKSRTTKKMDTWHRNCANTPQDKAVFLTLFIFTHFFMCQNWLFLKEPLLIAKCAEFFFDPLGTFFSQSKFSATKN